jgi:hypothetical protein
MSKWKCNLVDPKQWVDISFILLSFPSKSNIIMISVNYATKAKQNLDVANDTLGM